MSELSPDAKDLWERAKKGGLEPTETQVERVRRAVLGRIAAGPSSSGGGSSVGSLPKWVKIAGLCVGLGAIVVTGAKLAPRSTSVPAAAPEPTRPVAATTPEPPAPAPALEAPGPTEGEGVTSGRGVPAPDKAAREPSRAPPSAKSSAQDPDTLPEQVRIITDARLALRRRAFADALAKVSDYEARYPKGVFLEEELAIRALALCGLGRDKEAVRAREALERAVPNSRQLDRVRASCAGAGKLAP